MNKNKIKKPTHVNKNPIFIHNLNIVGIGNYKSKIMLNLSNSYIYKNSNNFKKLNYEYINTTNKHSSINTNLFVKNSIRLNKNRLNIIKNESKNVYKKNM